VAAIRALPTVPRPSAVEIVRSLRRKFSRHSVLATPFLNVGRHANRLGDDERRVMPGVSISANSAAALAKETPTGAASVESYRPPEKPRG